MLTLRISRSTPLPARCIKAPTVGKRTGNKAVGVSRGGRNTKIHVLVDGLGNPLAFLLSSGNDHDSKYAVSLLSQINIEESNIPGDKAYGGKTVRDYIDSQNAVYTIPPQSNVSNPWPIPTRNVIWLNVSFKNSNGFAGFLHAMINLTPHSWR